MKYAKRAAEMVNSPEFKAHAITAIVNNFKKGFITRDNAEKQLSQYGASPVVLN